MRWLYVRVRERVCVRLNQPSDMWAAVVVVVPGELLQAACHESPVNITSPTTVWKWRVDISEWDGEGEWTAGAGEPQKAALRALGPRRTAQRHCKPRPFCGDGFSL